MRLKTLIIAVCLGVIAYGGIGVTHGAQTDMKPSHEDKVRRVEATALPQLSEAAAREKCDVTVRLTRLSGETSFTCAPLRR